MMLGVLILSILIGLRNFLPCQSNCLKRKIMLKLGCSIGLGDKF